jgi:tRNA modification GTPase
MNIELNNDNIIAISTPAGSGAIGIIRLSGPQCVAIVDKFFFGARLTKADGNTVHYGKIKDEKGVIIDECIATVFKAPRSYTKEDVIELSCHGSPYILKSVMELFLSQGVRMAKAGEFTMRAFLNGQMDLIQAEAVADLIASETKSQHDIAIHQMRGGFSETIKDLREQLIHFASMLELENDFGEEDVEFADRSELQSLCQKALHQITGLVESFSYGNALKQGIPVTIVGRPNVGKSTLLNTLLQEDKAIISNIPGTTRDVIEDTINIKGILFRFVDTAGLRETIDEIESIGISKTYEKIEDAKIILYMDELSEDHKAIAERYQALNLPNRAHKIILLSKADTFHSCHMYDVEEAVSTLLNRTKTISISSTNGHGIDAIKDTIVDYANNIKNNASDVVVTNLRHYEALKKIKESLNKVHDGISSGISSDFVAMDIRHALHYIGEISGTVSTDDLLQNIFSNFCIGK